VRIKRGAPGAGVPAWGLGSAVLAPVLLIGGWTVAAAIQPQPFDSRRETISQLAALGMPHRFVMTVALAGLGLCHIVTATALRPVATAGRSILALAGLATALVATNPLPRQGGSALHTATATVSFVGLSLWPALASPAGTRRRGPTVLGRPLSLAAAAVLTALLLWFFLTLQSGSPQLGLAERMAAGAQALWPLAVVVALRRRRPVARWGTPGGL
jgi:hypothetical membrane protein